MDRTKALDAAQKYLHKGQYEKAIVEYQRIVQDDPKDARTLLKLGDLYTRQNRTQDATRTYRRVAEQYGAQGFFLKAVAVYKQILKLDPTQLDAREKLGEMYEMLSLVSDALATFEQVAAAYARNGQTDESLAAMRKMVQLDPDNIAAHIKHAEALSKATRTKEAADAFEATANLLHDQGRIDDYLKVAERLLFHRPDDLGLARTLARIYLQRQDPKHALAKLQVCFKADPKDVGTLELLAQAFDVLGQRGKTLSVYKEIARLQEESGQVEARVEVLQRIVALDPRDEEASLALATALAAARPLTASPTRRHADTPVESFGSSDTSIQLDDDDDDDILIIEDPIEYDLGIERSHTGPDTAVPPPPPSESAAPPGASSARPLSQSPSPPSGAPSMRPEDQIQHLLDECDVFMRYGLYEKVLSQLNQLLQQHPDNVPAREHLKSLFVRTQRLPEAVDQLVILAELTTASRSQAASYLQEALSIDPHHEVVRERLASLRVDLSSSDTADADDEDVIFFDEDERLSSPPPARGIAQEYTTQRDLPRISLDADPTLPDDIVDALEEIDFYASQGLIAEARATLEDISSAYPAHPLLLSRLEELTGRAVLPPLPAASQAPAADSLAPAAGSPATDDSFLFAQKLAAELDDAGEEVQEAGSGALDVDEVLAQFKKGVEEQVAPDDTATHYDLGIAYMEMGLHDEAIREFELCLTSADHTCTAHTMIGLSSMAKGDIEASITHFERGLAAQHSTESELTALYFELGNAHELLERLPDALDFYHKALARDADFRDAQARIERIESRLQHGETDGDEFDRLFDNMILK